MRQDDWFADLPCARRSLLLSLARRRELTAGRAIYHLGDAPTGLYGVASGEVRLIGHPAPGRQVLSLQLFGGAWFGELSVLDGAPRPHDAVMHSAGEVLFVPLARFEAAARVQPELIRDLARLLAARQRIAVRSAERRTVQSLGARLASTILGSARTADGAVRLTQEALGAMVGASRQAVNARLRVFEEGGALRISYGMVVVIDRERLKRLAFARTASFSRSFAGLSQTSGVAHAPAARKVKAPTS